MVALKKLWGDARFKNLSPAEKLVYIYLITQSSISVLGVVRVDLSDLAKLVDKSNKYAKACLLVLEAKKYIEFFEEGIITILISRHWNTLPRTKTNIQKALKEGREAEGELKKIFTRHYIKEDFETKYEFIPPTAQQVTDYAFKKGYNVDGAYFVEYYSTNDWYNKNNRKVRDWKATCDKVWCRDTNKINIIKGVPKGFENFHITTEGGIKIYPESWKEGQPMHSNFIYAALLKENFATTNV